MRHLIGVIPVSCVVLLCTVRVAAQEVFYADVTDVNLPPGLAGQCMDADSGDADGQSWLRRKLQRFDNSSRA